MSEVFAFPPLDSAGAALAGSASPLDRAIEIVEQARGDARRIEQQARDAGFQAGYEEGRAQACADVERQLELLSALIASISEARAAAVDQLERRAVELGLALAERIVSGALAVQPERIVDVVAGALRSIGERDRLTVVVSPEDVDLVRSSAGALAERLGGIEALEVVADRRVCRGGCIVRTSDGEVDAQVAEQLERVRELVRDAVGTAA